MQSGISGEPERRTSGITLDEIDTARGKLIEAALVFDAIEDGDKEVDWREGFELLRDAAQALGVLNTFDYAGIG